MDVDDRAPTLRLALAMRGGLSLAVWIGGAVAELDLLRRARDTSGDEPSAEDDRQGVYRELLDLAGYYDVEIDVLAGASAGGLNAVLYGVAQSCGSTVDELGRVWRQLGHLGRLLRPAEKRRGQVVSSLLRGDEYFYVQLFKQLNRFATSPRHRPTDHLTVALSATLLLSPGTTTELEPGAKQGRAYYSFVRRPTVKGSPLCEIPSPGAERSDFQAARMALAGRSTSSFPMAFEPATVPAYEASGPADAPAVERPAWPNMAAVFSAARDGGRSEDPYYVIDGGVFDNIAIRRALDAISVSPADRLTERWLIYLDPEPAKAAPPPPKLKTTAYRAVPAALRALAMRSTNQSVESDIDAIRRHNERKLAHAAGVEVHNGHLRALVTATPQAERAHLLDDIAGMRHCPAYARYRAAADLPRLGDLFVQPQQTVGRQAVFRFLNPARAVRAEELLLFRDPLTLAYQDRPLCERLGSDLTAVAATAGFLIAWVRSYEQWRRNAPGDCADTFPADRPLGEIKRVLYRLLTTAIILRDLSEHGLLAGGRPEATADWLGKAIEGVLDHQEALRLPDGLWQYLDVRDTPTRSPEAEEAEFYDSLAAAINTMDTGTPAVDRLWELLATALRLLTTDIAPASCSHGQCREWRESPYHLFLEFPEVLGAPDGVRRLEPLFAGAGGLPDSAGMVTFHVLDADERAHVDTMLPGLRAAKIKALAADICAGRHVDLSDDWLTYDVKLAGHQLGAFGGFLSARWRANDWMWGRADAAAVIVRLLLQRAVATKKMPAESVATTAATYGARLQESIINVDVEAAVHDPHEPAGTVEPPPPRRSSTALADLDTGMQSMSALAPSYRSRLAMCTGLIAYRAVWPVRWTATAILGRATLIAVRPLLLAALLFGMASRGTLVLALALGAGAAAHAGVNGHAPSRAVGIVVVLAAVLATLWARAIVAARHVRDTNPSTDIGRLAKQMAGRMLALRWATTLVTTIALAGAASVVTVRDGWPRIYHAIGTGPTESYLALLLLVAALGIGLARVGTGVVGRIHWAAVLVWCAALAVLVGVAVLSAWRHLLPADVPAGTAVAVGAGLVVVLTIVCVADWIRPAWLVLALFLATAGYAAWLWVATNWFPAVTVTHTLGGGLVTGLVAFAAVYTYVITIVSPARYPGRELP